MSKLLESTNTMAMDRSLARDLLAKYRKARTPATDEDRAIMTAYREIARGRIVIQAAQAIREAGWNEQGLPVLAMIRADCQTCRAGCSSTDLTFSSMIRGYERAKFIVPRMPETRLGWRRGEAVVPLVPLHLRPKHHLRNYWILWEADWKAIPHDPLLLRKLSGDLWLVLAAWDLTPVERAALENRRANA